MSFRPKPTLCVICCYAHLLHILRPLDPLDLVHFVFHWQPMSIPSKASFHIKTTLMGPSGDNVLDGPGQYVPVVVKTGGEGRPIVECVVRLPAVQTSMVNLMKFTSPGNKLTRAKSGRCPHLAISVRFSPLQLRSQFALEQFPSLSFSIKSLLKARISNYYFFYQITT